MLPNVSQSNENPTMRLGQLTEHNKRNIISNIQLYHKKYHQKINHF